MFHTIRNAPLAASLVALAGLVWTGFQPLQAAPEVPVRLRLVAEGLTSPLAMVPLPGGDAWVVDQIGLVRRLERGGGLAPAPVLDLRLRMQPLNQGAFDERGLLDLALHPDFGRNRRFFLTYSAPKRPTAPSDWDSTLRLSEFTVDEGGRIDPGSERVFLEIDQPYFNHNGGRLAFGPDGLLYLSVGDGGSANDTGKRGPHGNGQDLTTLLGKILRLDVDRLGDGTLYGIPADNPFADGVTGRPEIYAYGLRNVWGLSFDRGGDRALYAADVGQALFEEVNIIEKGGNYGWFFREGFEPFDAQSPNQVPASGRRTGLRNEPLLDPIAIYRHPSPRRLPDEFGISITGGHIYRGKAFPELVGHYVHGDWSRQWAKAEGVLLVAWRPESGSGQWKVSALDVASPEGWAEYITAFALDADGEVHVLTNGTNGLTPGRGKIWKMERP